MLSRFISRPSSSHLRSIVVISSNFVPLSFSSSPPLSHSTFFPRCNPFLDFVLASSRRFSSNGKNKGDDAVKDATKLASWKFSPEDDKDVDSVFGDNDGNLAGIADGNGCLGEESENIRATGSRSNDESWSRDRSEEKGDVFDDVDKQFESKNQHHGRVDEWETAEGYKPWTFVEEVEEGEIFDLGEVGDKGHSIVETQIVEKEKTEADKQLEKEEQELSAVLKGPNRAFGDLIAASGITESMLDSLIALKDLEGIKGLPPLRELEDMRFEKSTRKSVLHELELKKQEEVAKARVRQVDEKGRAYGTGRRKTSVARVWIQPGEGNFVVNSKQFDVYFPNLDDRAALLRPFVETNTLGLWDVNCTAKGGGVSGQAGAIRLGISRALQNWEPGLRASLKAVGFLTRDPRMVERKKPGKAKARKSFQWVKR